MVHFVNYLIQEIYVDNKQFLGQKAVFIGVLKTWEKK